eukprot:2961509-Pyramimonas_sp.AAC.2
MAADSRLAHASGSARRTLSSNSGKSSRASTTPLDESDPMVWEGCVPRNQAESAPEEAGRTL